MSNGSVAVVTGVMPGSPGDRWCCMLTSKVKGVNNIFDYGTHALDHKYGGGEVSGIVYTCRAGFIDLGHVRDLVDLTRYYHGWLTVKGKATLSGTAPQTFEPFKYDGEVKIVKTIPAADQLMVARSIAYDQSVFHEIESYWTGHPSALFGVDVPGTHNSSFSPDDLVSNFLGTHVGAKAIQNMATSGKSFDAEVTAELDVMLSSLGALDKAGTEDACAKAATRGWIGTDPSDEKYVMRRNFDISPVKPWLVPGVTSCPASPTPLTVPLQFPAGTSSYYDVRFDVLFGYSIGWRLRSGMSGASLKKSDFSTALGKIDADAKTVYGTNYKTP